MKLLSLLGVALCCGALALVDAMPLDSPQPAEHDPMLALPTGGQAEALQQGVEYVTYQQLPTTQAELQRHHQEANPGAYVGQSYELVEQQPGEQAAPLVRREFIEVQPQPDQGGQAAAEYPGQIIYVNDDRARASAASAPLAGLSATILTEVPASELTPEVLARLKSEYGVKVVATRERPGANLIINCDEYPAQENSICTRHAGQELQQQHPHQYQPAPQELQPRGPPLDELPPRHHNSFHVSHLIQPTSEQVAPAYEHAAAAPQEAPPSEAPPREAVEYVSSAEQGGIQEQQAGLAPTEAVGGATQDSEHELYGHRTTLAADEQPAGEAAAEPTAQPTPADPQASAGVEAETSRPSEGQDSYEQSAGFDEQSRGESADQTRPEAGPSGHFYSAQS